MTYIKVGELGEGAFSTVTKYSLYKGEEISAAPCSVMQQDALIWEKKALSEELEERDEDEEEIREELPVYVCIPRPPTRFNVPDSIALKYTPEFRIHAQEVTGYLRMTENIRWTGTSPIGKHKFLPLPSIVCSPRICSKILFVE